MPTLLAALPPQFKQLHARSSCTLATVRYTCVQKGGGSMCALQGAQCTGAFERPEADDGRGLFGRCPLAELGQDPVRRNWRQSRPLLRA